MIELALMFFSLFPAKNWMLQLLGEGFGCYDHGGGKDHNILRRRVHYGVNRKLRRALDGTSKYLMK